MAVRNSRSLYFSILSGRSTLSFTLDNVYYWDEQKI